MADPLIQIPAGKKLRLEVTPLHNLSPLLGRVCGVCGCEATPQATSSLPAAFIRAGSQFSGGGLAAPMSQEQLFSLEKQLRDCALGTHDFFLLGLNAMPVVESQPGQFSPFLAQAKSSTGTTAPGNDNPWLSAALGGGSKGGVYQLMSFPLSRFNGVPLPVDSRIRFADPSRWLQGGMESRLFTVSVDGTKKYYSWDAHAPVGKTPHDFYHVNQKGMASVFGHTDHAALSGTALVQAKQLRYLKLGGRVFLVVGVVVDTAQLGSAAYTSYEQQSIKPIAAQTVRTAGGWAAAWAGAKAGVALGGLAGVETGPGMVLTAIGGGVIGGFAGYLGADWIADWIYED